MFYLVFCIAVLTRLLPHPPNVVCVAAMGLLAGCYLRSSGAYLLPVAAMFVSDVIGHLFGLTGMGFYNPITMVAVYAGMMASVAIGRRLRERPRAWGIAAASLTASTIFFIVSNFGVWLVGAYPATPAGLLACYTAAVPFYGLTLMGDLVYCGIFFAAFEIIRHHIPERFLGPAIVLPQAQRARV